jgi:hypothetical protein
MEPTDQEETMNTAVAPSPVLAPWVWSAEELTAREDWVIEVESDGLADIATALAGVKKRGLPIREIKAHDFPLPSMAGDLLKVKQLLALGPGVCLLRGLPVDRYGREDIELILWGIGTHVGEAIVQSYRGDVIGEVMDKSHEGDTRRAYRSPLALNLHIDSVDVVALLCLRRAKRGGMSLVTSSFAIHNAILEERPDLMPVLYRGFHCVHAEADSSGEDPITPHRIPVFGPGGDQLICNFHARPMARSLGEDGLGNDPKSLEALEVFKEISERDDLVHRRMLEPGDLQFLNNRTVLHGRTEFEDYDSLDRKRLMLRLWLAMPDWIALPDNMKNH